MSVPQPATDTVGTMDTDPAAPHKRPLSPALATDDVGPPSAKKSRTNRDRREHFKKNQSWKSRNQEDVERAKRVDEKDDGDDREDNEDKDEKEVRLPKKKVAVLVGFCGTGYQGMQINPNAKTIEGELFKSFIRAGAVSKDNSNDPHKVSLMRAARTDKGVHAAGNLLSMKMVIGEPDIVKRINEELPEQIRVW
ncbi:pseudouridine synthase, partial [Jimgerdemannia flammicorona]